LTEEAERAKLSSGIPDSLFRVHLLLTLSHHIAKTWFWQTCQGGAEMRKRLFSILVAMGLIVAALPAPAAQADSHGAILGIQWQWAQLTETEPASQSVVPDPENYVLVLTDDGSAILKADCNMVHWTYTIEGDTISFNTLGPATLAYCGEDSSDQIFLAKLGMGGTWRVEDGRLVLELNENAGTMVFANGGAAETAPEAVPETGGALLVVPWAITVLAGLAALGTSVALRRRQS
jgi:heat shock protein HslJ